MQLSLGAAARAAGIAKSTVSKAIASGRLSAAKQENGSYKIEAAELFRVFQKPSGNVEIGRSATPGNGGEHLYERERELLLDQIRDLRARLDRSEQRAERLTALLTDSRAPPSPAAAVPDQRAAPAPIRRWWRFGR